MQSRMNKYEFNTSKFERSRKNTKLYEDVYDDIYRDTTYKNMEVIDSAKEININKLKNLLDDKYDTRQYRTFKASNDLDIDDALEYKPRRKIYDINEILDDAKNKRAFIEEAKEKRKYINFSSKVKANNNIYDELEKEEQELEDLINTIAISKENNDSDNIFQDLMGSENTLVTKPIVNDSSISIDEETKDNLEKTLVKADKTFYTDSNMFTKNDFEDFSTLNEQLEKSKKRKKVFLVILALIILTAIGYFIVNKFILK